MLELNLNNNNLQYMPFKPGQSGNPNGRPLLVPELKEIKTLNQFEFHRILNDLSFKTKEELQAKINNPETTVLELAIASILAKSIQSGDPTRLEYVTTHLGLKPKERIEITNPYAGLPREKLIELAQEEIRLLKEKNEQA
jgi:hypothetical protein